MIAIQRRGLFLSDDWHDGYDSRFYHVRPFWRGRRAVKDWLSGRAWRYELTRVLR